MKKTLIKKDQQQKTKLQSKEAERVIQNLIIKSDRIETADVGTWRSAVNDAMRGNRTKLYQLYANLLSDSVLADAVDKITNAVTNAEIMFQIDGQSIEEIEDLMDSEEFEKLLKEIALKFVWGKSVIDVGFAPEFSVYSFPRKNIRIVNYEQPISQRKKFIAIKDTDLTGFDYTKNEFIIECGEDDDLGLIWRAALFVIYKRGGWGDWAQFVELFAMPFLVGEYEGYDESSRNQLFAALGQIGSNPRAAVPKGTNLKVYPNNSSGSSNTYDTFTDKCDDQILIAMYGNTMTTKDGSSRSQSEVHKEIMEEKFKAIRRYTQRVLNQKLLPLLIKRGYNVAGGFFSFPDAGESIPTGVRIDMGLKMKAAGLPVDEDWFFEVSGVAKAESKTEPEKEDKEEPKKTDDSNDDNNEDSKETPKEKPQAAIKNSDDQAISLGIIDKVLNFFVNAPTTWSGAGRSFFKKLKTRITGKIELADDYSIDINKLINEAIREVYGGKEEKQELVNKNIFEANNNPLQHGVDTELIGFKKDNPHFVQQFKESSAVFAAFKSHKQTEAFVEALRDEKGNIRSFYKFRKECLKIGEKFNDQYLKTEYNTLIRSLRVAANLKQYEKTLHLYPNLKYIESNAVHPRLSHLQYVGTILPFYHEAWTWLMPPSEWNCDCSVRPTDEEPTEAPIKPEGFDPVFDNNPVDSGEFVNIKETPYYKNTDSSLLDDIEKRAKQLLKETEATKEIYEGKNGGYLEIVKQQSNEREKNLVTYKMLADRGGKYSLLDASKIENIKNPDAFNFTSGQFSDAKHPTSIIGKNAIQASIREASKQRVEEVVIRLQEEYSNRSLFEGMKAALQGNRARSLKKIILIRKDQDPITFEVAELRQYFKK